MRGKLIVFEGLDKTGKTSCVNYFESCFSADDLQFVIFKFPFENSLTGSIITSCREGLTEICPRALHLIFSANRWEKMATIKAYLDNGVHVICDRYFYSGIAYSVGRWGLDFDWCCNVEQGMIIPDVVFYLSASKEVLLSRGFGEDLFEDKIERIHSAYMSLFDDWILINVNKPLEKVYKDITSHFRKCIKL